MTLKEELQHLLNKCCAENASNTPDFILAEYLYDCLKAFEKASNAREKWYDVKLEPGQDMRNLEDALRRGLPVCYESNCQCKALHFSRPRESPLMLSDDDGHLNPPQMP